MLGMHAMPRAGMEPCPYLPDVGGLRHPASALAVFRQGIRGAGFYRQALCCAQSRWLDGLPAQALLMLNRAFAANLDPVPGTACLVENPLPYRALVWILQRGEGSGFLGNPRRHFQHLATRMRGPDRELRTVRAWACWELAKSVNPDWPPDREQIESESLVEPTRDEIVQNLARQGLPGEVEEWWRALGDA